MMKELETVVLAEDLAEHGLHKGDLGTVVMVHQAGAAYEVEFVTLEGETIAVATLTAQQVRPVDAHEIAHARALAG
ncbi:MAG: DUF4926 domain-containing protein [Armatimonadia bacterium]